MANLLNDSIAAGAVQNITVTDGQTVLLAHNGPIAAFCLANSGEIKIYGGTKADGVRLAVPGTVLRLKNPGPAAVNVIVSDAV